MVFAANPLSLSVPDPAFESWLRDSGYLEILDERTTTTASHSSATARHSSSVASTISAAASTSGFFSYIFSYLGTLFSLFSLNPFAKLTADEFAGETPSWTLGFIGLCDSYSFPSSPSQARLRVHENIKRYARNYATLFLLFFACTLYQMPLTLLGLISSLGLWEGFRLCSDGWGWERYPVIRLGLVRLAQCGTAVILYCSNVQMALFCAIGVGYAAMIFHASFRKLTPAKQPARGDGYRRFQQNKQRS
ncbi:hypothetical protein HHK36_001838 [Tetracentron sinense]|uniref:PRA1 family protein n=1 Tax=Tetracentron sinense TaxID=13715 RepID=A0A834ZUD5_TETSI|nr:hypothetical protein HHK36_001838 [Tetracentron sinense]